VSAIVQVRWLRAGPSARGVAILILSLAALGSSVLHLYPQIIQFLTGGRTFCMMKQVAGIPCVACRGTRAAIALAKGRVDQALYLNPLATLFILTVGGLIGFIAVTGKMPEFSWDPAWKKLGIILLVFALLGNWIYVIAAGG